MATSRADAARLVEAAAARPGKVSLEASCRFSRLSPKYPFVKELVECGRIGHVYHIHHREMNPDTFAEYNPRSREWADDPELAGGGPIVDWGPYDFAFHLGLIGDPTPARTIDAIARMERGIERHVIATIELLDGITYQLERIQGMPYQEASCTRIHGALGIGEVSRAVFCAGAHFPGDRLRPRGTPVRVSIDGSSRPPLW
ncbi:MAG: Gfo/Idh/MocA family protein [Spirochaetota bacterium]